MNERGIIVVMVVVMMHCAAQETKMSFIEDNWKQFKVQHQKEYKSELEEKLRKEIFWQNNLMVLEHNLLYAQNLTTFNLALNHLGDKLPQEISSSLTGITNQEALNTSASFIPPDEDVVLPSSVDWRRKGAVTTVKSQGQCASGWAFATTGSLEGQVFRNQRRLVSMSEQNLIDCCHLCYGCVGGRMDYAFTYIMQNGGIDSEISYPYEARNNVCRYHPATSVARVKGYASIHPGDENALKAAVATIGPIAVAIDASLSTFHYYTHGVYYDPHCSSTQLTHGALVVGYGSEWGRDYWLVKNSWGPNWGDHGYIKMARNLNNNCGIASAASYPFV